MADFVTVAKKTEIPAGEGRVVQVNGRDVALFNLDGTFYAVDNYCVHQGGPLGEGVLDGECVVCPWHSWRYSVKTGVSPVHASVKVETYPVRLDGDNIQVAV
jgi:nitrite reductase/ring-hydroxylating ferredoxin subunit